MSGKIDFGFLLSINNSVVRARDRDGGAGGGFLQMHSFRARLKAGAGASAASTSVVRATDSVERIAPEGSVMTVENAKRIRAMSGGHLPSIWRRLGVRTGE